MFHVRNGLCESSAVEPRGTPATASRAVRFGPGVNAQRRCCLHPPRWVAQKHANRRILCQDALCRSPSCLVDLTAIPNGQRIKGWCADWANFHFLRDPGSRDPNVRIAFNFLWWRLLDPLRAGECSGCHDRQNQRHHCGHFHSLKPSPLNVHPI